MRENGVGGRREESKTRFGEEVEQGLEAILSRGGTKKVLTR